MVSFVVLTNISIAVFCKDKLWGKKKLRERQGRKFDSGSMKQWWQI